MSSSSRPGSLLMLLGGMILLGLVAYVGWQWKKGQPPPLISEPDAETLQINTRGVGFMEQFEYAQAEVEFQKVVACVPGWLPGQINLAMAKYNQQEPKSKVEEAIQLFQNVLTKDPESPHAHYCLGYLLKYNGELETAIPHFEAVIRIDPNDAGSYYQVSSCLTQLGRDPGRSLQYLEKATELDPYLFAATNALQLQLRATDPARADAILNVARQLEGNERITLTSHKYTEEGSKYAEVIGRPAVRLPAEAAAPLPLFQTAESFRVNLPPGTSWAKASDLGIGPLGDLRRAVRQRFGATIITLDYNGDGKPDLFLVGAVVENGQVRDLLLRNDGNGVFTDVTRAAGLAEPRSSLGCCAGDFDNDGHTDLFVSGAGVQKMFRNKRDGTFEDVSSKCDLDKFTAVCLGCCWVDLDQDGDLDLVLGRIADTPEQALATLNGAKGSGGSIAVWLNIGEALPGPLGKPSPGLTTRLQRFPDLEKMSAGATVGIVVTDADGDHDLDLILLEDAAPPTLVLNDRLLRFRRANSLPAEAKRWNGALVLDSEHTERSDILLLAVGQTPLLLRNQASPGRPGDKLYEKGAVKSPPLRQARVVDIDLDGWSDIVGLSEEGKPVLLHNDRGGRLVHAAEALGLDRDWPSDLVAVLPTDFDGDGNPDLLLWSESSGLQLRRSHGNGNQALNVQLWGRRDSEKKPASRTNNDGIGVRLALQTGRHWTGIENTTLSAGLGQSAGPLELGIGRASPNDVIARVYWPDLVIQAEFCGVEKHKDIWRIEETNRKGVSCPVLLTWNGERFVYVTDFLGEGSAGEMLAGGGTRPPRPEESVKIEANQLKPRDGYYVIKVTQPMDEVIYLDRLQLAVVDHPPETTVFPDERFATGGKPPTQELLYFRDKLFPVAARDHRGRDVTATVRQRDGKMVDAFQHRSWLGFAEEHWVELDFGDQLAKIGANERLYLVLAGWTDYPYPEAIFAATQAGVPMTAPVLEKRGADGKWTAVDEIGFPAGLPRVMTKDVTGLLAGHSGKCRIRTNLQIYWDQIFLARPVAVRQQETALEVAEANLAIRGFLRELHPDHTPLIAYDPERVEAVPVVRWQGFVTRLGDVTELLHATDDRFVILAPGDEVTIKYDARGLPPLPSGWTRSFVLRTWGYCKDAAPFTATGGNVLPLPFRSMKQYPPGADEKYPHPGDLRTWHTRRPN